MVDRFCETTMKEFVTAATTVAEVLLKRPLPARILVNHRVHCVGCPMAPLESVSEACEIYGVSLPDLLAELNPRTWHIAEAEILRHRLIIGRIGRSC